MQFLNSNGIIRILNSSVMGIESGCATLNIRYMGYKMKVKPIAEIENALTPIAEAQGLEIVEVELKQSKSPSLTIYIDKDGGVPIFAALKTTGGVFPLCPSLTICIYAFFVTVVPSYAYNLPSPFPLCSGYSVKR